MLCRPRRDRLPKVGQGVQRPPASSAGECSKVKCSVVPYSLKLLFFLLFHCRQTPKLVARRGLSRRASTATIAKPVVVHEVAAII